MSRQRGFTLVELMVAMGLGLLISLAATQLFVANQVSFNFQRSTGDVQANGRYGLDQIANDLRMAGLVNLGDVPVSGVVMTTSDAPVGSANLSQDNSQVSGINKSDQLTVQYAAPSTMLDCEGNTVAQGTYLVERYFVTTDPDDANVHSLACDSATYVGATLTNPTPNGVVLTPGVDSMKVLYGLDDGVINGVPTVARWVSAGTYTGMSPRPVIVAVRVGLLVRSTESIGNGIAAPGDIWVLNTKIAQASIPNDNHLRRLFVTSVALRNVDPTGI